MDETTNSPTELTEKITLLDAILMIHSAWQYDLSTLTISSSWKKCGFENKIKVEVLKVNYDDWDNENGGENGAGSAGNGENTSGNGAENDSSVMPDAEAVMAEHEVDMAETPTIEIDWDNELEAHLKISLTEEDIVAAVNEGEDDEEVEEDEIINPPTDLDMRRAMATLRQGLVFRGFDRYELLNDFEEALDDTLSENITICPELPLCK